SSGAHGRAPLRRDADHVLRGARHGASSGRDGDVRPRVSRPSASDEHATEGLRMNDGRTALFPGTFDPFTNGHLDLTRRAMRLFDRVIVAVAPSPAKGTLFDVDERVEMIRAATRSLRRVEVVTFSDLVVECARRLGAQVMIRGLRAVSDFEFEFQ